MDMKYDKMVAITKQESIKKVKEAKKALEDMLEGMEKISVTCLAERTGLSKGFFYKNPEVRNALEEAKHFQKAEGYQFKPKLEKGNLSDLQTDLIETRLQNRELTKRNQSLEETNKELKKQLEKLQGRLKHKEVSILKSL